MELYFSSSILCFPSREGEKHAKRCERSGVNEAESFASVLRAMRKTSYLADVSCPLLIGKKSSRCPGGADTATATPRTAASGSSLEKRAH